MAKKLQPRYIKGYFKRFFTYTSNNNRQNLISGFKSTLNSIKKKIENHTKQAIDSQIQTGMTKKILPRYIKGYYKRFFTYASNKNRQNLISGYINIKLAKKE